VPERNPLVDKPQPAAAAVFIKHRPEKDLAAQVTLQVVPIDEATDREVEVVTRMLEGQPPTELTRQNIQARLRGQLDLFNLLNGNTITSYNARYGAAWPQAVAEVGAGRARVWRLYMAASAMNFEAARTQIHQVLAVRDDHGAGGMPLRPDWDSDRPADAGDRARAGASPG